MGAGNGKLASVCTVKRSGWTIGLISGGRLGTSSEEGKGHCEKVGNPYRDKDKVTTKEGERWTDH